MSQRFARRPAEAHIELHGLRNYWPSSSYVATFFKFLNGNVFEGLIVS